MSDAPVSLKLHPPEARVRMNGASPEILFAIFAVGMLFYHRGYPFIITSFSDGDHSTKSKHNRGDAFDLRTKHLPPSTDKLSLKQTLSEALGPDYDVVLERVGMPGEHIHVEYDPRR